VLELGCANGFVSAAFARAGYDVTAIDLSPRMIERAEARFEHLHLRGRFLVGDVDDLPLAENERFDAVIGLLGTFYDYSRAPRATLARLARMEPQKIVLDVRVGTTPVDDVRDDFCAAGSRNVRCRPFVRPRRTVLPALAYPLLGMAERPPLAWLLMRFKSPNLVVGGRFG
jgi:SAM-dependent methyltransferase